MTAHDRRRAERIAIGLPARLLAEGRFLDADIRDLSRVGVRIRLRVEHLGLAPTPDLRVAAEGIARALGSAFTVNLHYQRLGPLVQRGVTLERLTLPAEAPHAIDLGCAFDHPLHDEEAAVLEVALPQVQEEALDTWEATRPVACGGTMIFTPAPAEAAVPALPPATAAKPAETSPPAGRKAARPRQRYRALVTSLRADGPPAVFCHTDLVTAYGVRVRLPRQGARRAVAALDDLTARLGSPVSLRLIDAQGDVYAGRARLAGAEIAADPDDDLLISLAFERRPRSRDLQALGLMTSPPSRAQAPAQPASRA